jgi:hypothetical protein
MKVSTLILFVFLLKSSESLHFEKANKSISNLCKAVSLAVLELNVNTSATVNIISSDKLENFASKDFRNNLLSEIFVSSTVACRYESSNATRKLFRRRRSFMIFAIQTFEEFLDIHEKIIRDIFKFNGRYLVVLTCGIIAETREIFKLLWKLQIFNVNVMFEDENGEVLVQTFLPFNAQNCNDTTPILINKFKDGKFINGTDNFFPQKMKNLHNCPVRVAIAIDNQPYIIQRTSMNGSHDLTGRDIHVLKSLSKSLNFRIDYTYIGEEGYFYPNGTSIGPLKTLLDGDADISISNWWLKESRLKFFDTTIPYAADQLVFVVPPGKELSALEKLVYPFKLLTWVAILFCFLIGFVIIFIIKRQTRNMQDFVFGTGVKHPYLNLFEVFLGVSQKKLPGRNFARFLLMMFLMYSLVIRTVYQASFYQLLKSNKQHMEVQTVDEIIEKEFKFYVYLGNEDVYHSSAALKSR